ncbi:MAG TPA: MFS transporter, partial [Candidatus Lokiarchaeia archaeon]
PTFSDVIDEIVLKTGKKNEGMYTGIRTFFGRTSNIIGAIVFAVVHTFTAYQPGASYQIPLALWGIRVIMVLIPMTFYLISFLLVWKIYDLTPEKVQNNQSELKTIKL